MPKLTLVANPTFTADVPIPVAGGEPVNVKMTFKHRTRKEWDEWLAASKARAESDTPRTPEDDVNSFMDFVVGWDFEEEFNKENVALLLQNHYTAGYAAVRVYSTELWASKVKN